MEYMVTKSVIYYVYADSEDEAIDKIDEYAGAEPDSVCWEAVEVEEP